MATKEMKTFIEAFRKSLTARCHDQMVFHGAVSATLYSVIAALDDAEKAVEIIKDDPAPLGPPVVIKP